MRLIDLLLTINENVFVWISTDPNADAGIYFGSVAELPATKAKGYMVEEIYVEPYGAIYGHHGISIIVKKEDAAS